MEHMTRRRCVAMTMGGLPVLAGLAAYTAGAHGSWGETERPRFQKVGAGSARAEIQRRHLPNVPLVTHDGRRVRFYEDLVRDKKVVLTFVSSRAPAFSDTVTSNLATLQRLFGSRVGADMFLYTIARDPERDTQAMLKDWAVWSGAGSGWKFLTGRPADVEALRRGLGFASPDPGKDADPAYAVGIVRYGVEPEMRWAHCQSQAPPRVLAHSLLLDFGTGPAAPTSPIFEKFQRGAAPGAAPIWDCHLLLRGVA
jgi:protein SCO1